MPGIPGCRSAGVDVLSDAALMARWHLGHGATLCIACNLGAEPCDHHRAGQPALFATPAAAEATTATGILRGRSTIVWISS